MKLLIASAIDPQTIEQLQAQHEAVCAFSPAPEALKKHLADRDVLIFRSGVNITSEVMASAPQLKLIIRAGSGFDNIDVAHAKTHGIRLVRIPGPSAQAVAEMAFALMLGLSRRVLEADRLWRLGRWMKTEMTGFNLNGKTLGIVGCGNIGTRAGQIGVALGMNVLGCVEHESPQVEANLRKHNITLKHFHEVLAESDFVSIHVPLQNSTRNLFNSDTLAMMKRGAFLVNLARGGVVNEAALLRALTEGHVRGAGLDVHEKEGDGKISILAGLPNVILTPHIGASTHDAQREIGQQIMRIMAAFLAGDPTLGVEKNCML
jgi:D-3-phosphoglycerate dehydrogenase